MSSSETGDGVRVGIVADDLTGAADTAVQFTLAGWPTRLVLNRGDEPDDLRGATAVSSDARALGDDARVATAEAVASLRQRGAQRLYLKVDSTMRGSVDAQVAGVLDASAADSIALVCPAYPSMGRLVTNGLVSANGELLQHGPAGRDPITPVTTSVITELLPDAVFLPPTGYSTAPELLEAAIATGAGAICLDAQRDEDLDVMAEAVSLSGQRLVAVGSAGLARALARRWRSSESRETPVADVRRAGAVAVMVSSLHDVAANQVVHLVQQRGLSIVHLTPSASDLVDPTATSGWHARLNAATQLVEDAATEVVVISAPPRQPGGADASRIATALAEVVAHLHNRAPLRGIVAVGGDGVAALARCWSSASMTLHGAVTEGVPYGVLDGGNADALPIVTKAGGFGDSDTLVACVTHLLRPVALREDRP